MPVDMSRIPAQTQQAVAASRGATNAQDMETVLATLAQDPEAMSQALAALGIQVSPEQLQQVAENWVDDAADRAKGESTDDAETPSDAEAEAETEGEDAGSPQQPAAPSAPQAPSAPSAPVDANGNPVASADEGDTEELSARSRAPSSGAMAQAAAGGSGAMPTGGSSSSGGGTMDDLISAAMMQQMAGNPEAAVPTGPRAPNVGRPQLPHSASAAASADPRMRGMIANIYRSVAGQNAAADRVGVPTRPRVQGGTAARPRRATTRRNENAS